MTIKNGTVRKVQRYRCSSCKYNFTNDFKRRWDPSSKLINLISLRFGEDLDVIAQRAGASSQTVERWLLEAKDRNSWFIRALAEQAVFSLTVAMDPLEKAISGVCATYVQITGDTSEGGIRAFLDDVLPQTAVLLEGCLDISLEDLKSRRDEFKQVLDLLAENAGG